MDVEKFIGAVYIRTSLWDKKDINHHNRYILDKLWKEIGNQFSVSRDCARGRWKALRDKFRSTLAKISQRQLSGEGDPNDCIISWPYYRSLLFLKEQFNERKQLRDHSAYSDSLHDPDDNDKSCDNYHDNSLSAFGDPQEKYSPASADFLLPRSNNNLPSPATHDEKFTEKKNDYGKRPRPPNDDVVKDLMHVENKKLKYLKSLKDKVESADEDMSFFKSIIPHVKDLNSIDKMSFRIQVMRCVQEVLAKKSSNNPQSSGDTKSGLQINGEPYTITVTSATAS